MKNLDDKDHAIMKALKENAKLSTQQLSKKTKIPIATVHNRIKKLESSGIIRGYTTLLNEELTGTIISFVFISVMYHLPDGKVIDQEGLASKVKKSELVEESYVVTGSRDLIVKVRTKNIGQLNDFIIKYLRTIPGIERTETAVVLKCV
ncbi:Lrp/AsnC family transcriptional regulator [Candidatus Woesearchaeota archaeon]|nr:Lrp/AsnC family transcriptional regulator [Candidatus Woesearchaeota archaeon]